MVSPQATGRWLTAHAAACGGGFIPSITTGPMGRRTIPLGAIAVHLGIGSVYAWSTLNLPLIAAMPTMPRWAAPPYSTFTTALVLLGLSAALLLTPPVRPLRPLPPGCTESGRDGGPRRWAPLQD